MLRIKKSEKLEKIGYFLFIFKIVSVFLCKNFNKFLLNIFL